MIAFVILHYKNIQDTEECLASIKKIKGDKKTIVVDNGTLDDKQAKKLAKKVDDLILLKENIGFAKANNLGIKTVQTKYQPDFVAVINNDAIIDDPNWIITIKEIWDEEPFAILGPKIICEKGSGSVNPYKPLVTIEEVEKELSYQKKLLVIYQNSFLRFLLRLYIKVKAFFFPHPIPENGEEKAKNVALHGCALIFSKNYLDQYEEAFIPETFLYHEESFLYQRILKDNLLTIYDPKLTIIHKEGQSIKDLPNYQKLIFKTTEIIKSLEKLKINIKENQKSGE